MVGSAAVEEVPGDVERIGLFSLLFAVLSESWVTGRMVVPLTNWKLEDDLGERGVRGLGPSELWAPGVKGDETFASSGSDLNELRSKLDMAESLVGITGVDKGASSRSTECVSGWLKLTNSQTQSGEFSSWKE